jgi:hypothetical protein
MVSPNVVLALIISKISLSRVPSDVILILCNLVTNPKITHLYQTGALAFDCIICNANGSSIVAMNGGLGLWVS